MNTTENLAETGKGMLQDAIMAGVPNTYEAGYAKGVEVMEKKKKELRAKIEALKLQLEKVQKSIAEDRSSSNKLTYMVDQGGGSFTAYIFAPGAHELAKIKSSKHPELLDAELMAAFKSETGIHLYNKADGTFNDFSCIDPEHYRSLTQILAQAYKAAMQTLAKGLGDKREIKAKIVRQTGKIRAKLMTQECEKEKLEYERCMQDALGNSWDFSLLGNKREAEQECGAFFTLNPHTGPSHIGLGIGSSSTQGYALNSANPGELICTYDTALGAKPTSHQKKAGKEHTIFAQQFRGVIGPLVKAGNAKLTLVCLNAVGYILLKMTKWKDCDKYFVVQLMSGKGMKPAYFAECARKYAEENPGFGPSLLLGLATAAAEMPQIKNILLERKGDVGESLDFETSWIRYAVSKLEATSHVIERLHRGGYASPLSDTPQKVLGRMR